MTSYECSYGRNRKMAVTHSGLIISGFDMTRRKILKLFIYASNVSTMIRETPKAHAHLHVKWNKLHNQLSTITEFDDSHQVGSSNPRDRNSDTLRIQINNYFFTRNVSVFLIICRAVNDELCGKCLLGKVWELYGTWSITQSLVESWRPTYSCKIITRRVQQNENIL